MEPVDNQCVYGADISLQAAENFSTVEDDCLVNCAAISQPVPAELDTSTMAQPVDLTWGHRGVHFIIIVINLLWDVNGYGWKSVVAVGGVGSVNFLG